MRPTCPLEKNTNSSTVGARRAYIARVGGRLGILNSFCHIEAAILIILIEWQRRALEGKDNGRSVHQKIFRTMLLGLLRVLKLEALEH